MPDEYTHGAFTISTDPAKLQIAVIHAYLSQESYWAQNIPQTLLEKAIQHSFNFGVYTSAEQVGFARVVTDYATFALLCDVFILPAYQGQGLGKWLTSIIVTHPELQGLRRFALYTKDAHGLYAAHGFQPVAHPGTAMEIRKPHPYQNQTDQQK